MNGDNPADMLQPAYLTILGKKSEIYPKNIFGMTITVLLIKTIDNINIICTSRADNLHIQFLFIEVEFWSR